MSKNDPEAFQGFCPGEKNHPDCIPDGKISLAPLKAVDENNTDLAYPYRSHVDSMQNTIWMLGSFCSKRSPAALLEEVLKEPVEMAGQCL